MKTQGKLSVKGCSNMREEHNTLMDQAKRSKKKQKEIEKAKSYMIVPILKGEKYVEVSRYEANMDHYIAMATGVIRKQVLA